MADSTQQSLSYTDYTVACICSMGIEPAPAVAMLDQTHSPLPTARDQNAYTLGCIGKHKVVVAVMPEIGNKIAATVITQLVNDFPAVRFALLVGIGGGVPGDDEDNDIRVPTFWRWRPGRQKKIVHNRLKTQHVVAMHGGKTALHWALETEHEETVEWLVRSGADVYADLIPFRNPFHVAAKTGSEKYVRFFFKKGADLNEVGGTSSNRFDELFLASRNGHVGVIRLLLKLGADIHTAFVGRHPLSLASENGHTEIVQILLENGADVNEEDGGFQPLKSALRKCRTGVVRVLLESGASTNNLSPRAKQVAAESGDSQLAQLLTERGVSLPKLKDAKR